jgi:hypothetical protein
MADVSIQITGNNEGLLAALDGAKAAVANAAAEMQGSFAKVTGMISGMQNAVLGFASLFAGGALFKDLISSTVGATTEAILMGRQFGISATQASILKLALAAVFVTQEQFSSAGNAITRTLKTNEDSFKQLGVATRDANGNLRPTVDIILDVNSKLATFKEGTDRNVEGMKIYGRAWKEVAPTIGLTSEAMAAAKITADALGLTVGQEGEAANKRYRTSMDGVHNVLSGVANVIASALLPVLSSLGEWFGSIGPQVVQAFRDAIAGLEIAFEGLLLGINIIAETIKTVFMSLGTLALTFTIVITKALHFDGAGAAAAWRAGMTQIENEYKTGADNIVRYATETHDKMVAAMEPPKVTPIAPEQTGDAASVGNDKDLMARLQAQLDEIKANYAAQGAAQGEFHEFSKQMELDYWQNILATTKLNTKEQLEVRKTIATLSYTIAKDSAEAQLATLKDQEAQFKGNLDAKLAIAQDYAAKVGRTYGLDSKQYAAAAKDILVIERDKVAQLLQIDKERQTAIQALALAQVDRDEENAKLATDFHLQTNAQLLSEDQQFEDRRFAIKQTALQQEKSLIDPANDPVGYAKILTQLEQLESQHEIKMQQIRSAAIKEQNKDWTALFGNLQSGFANVISGYLKGTATFSQSIRALWVSIADAIIQVIAQVAAQWLVAEVAQLVFGRTAAGEKVRQNAAVAGSGGVASWAAAPWPVDVGAPAFGASMAALAGGFAVAAGGYDIPSGVNPLTQLHANEMVLPATLADTVRQGAGGGGQAPNLNVSFHISAIDTQTGMAFIKGQMSNIAKGLRTEVNKFNPHLRPT